MLGACQFVRILSNSILSNVRQIVSDTMLMLKFVILLKLCLNATMNVVSISELCRVLADAAS